MGNSYHKNVFRMHNYTYTLLICFPNATLDKPLYQDPSPLRVYTVHPKAVGIRKDPLFTSIQHIALHQKLGYYTGRIILNYALAEV